MFGEELAIIVLHWIGVGAFACVSALFIFFIFQHRKGSLSAILENKFIMVSLGISASILIAESSYGSYLDRALGLLPPANLYEVKVRFYVTTVFDVIALDCHVALLYMRMMALLEAEVGKKSLKVLGRLLAGCVGLFGFLTIVMLSVDLAGRGKNIATIELCFSLFSTLFGFSMASVDLLSTALFVRYLRSIEGLRKGKNSISVNSESTRIIASMGVVIAITSLIGTIFYGSAAFTSDLVTREWLKLVMGYALMLMGALWMIMKWRLDVDSEKRANAASSSTVTTNAQLSPSQKTESPQYQFNSGQQV
jgi:hypothetical protein